MKRDICTFDLRGQLQPIISRLMALSVLMICGIVDCGQSSAQTQSSGPSKFEVASVKANLTPPRDGAGIQTGPDSLIAKNVALKQLILWAFLGRSPEVSQ